MKLFAQAFLVWAYSLRHLSKNYATILLEFYSLVIRWSDKSKLDRMHTYHILKYIYAIQPTHAFVPAVWHTRKSEMKTKGHTPESYTCSHNTGSTSVWMWPSQQRHIKQALSIPLRAHKIQRIFLNSVKECLTPLRNIVWQNHFFQSVWMLVQSSGASAWSFKPWRYHTGYKKDN